MLKKPSILILDDSTSAVDTATDAKIRKALREEIADRLNLPAGAAGVVRVTLMGARRALIEDHRGIASYSRERVEINAGAHRVCIDGEGLELEAMDREALLVTGRILSVELE